MIPTLAIITIFLQIFTASITISGVYSFVMRYLSKKVSDDYYLSLIFLTFSIYGTITIVSQMIYTLGESTNIRFFLYKLGSIVLVLGALAVAYFLRQKFKLRSKLIFNGFFVLCLIEIFMIIRSPLNLVENVKGLAIDPGVHFLSAFPPEIFWVVLWSVLGIRYILSARSARLLGEKNIFNLAGTSSLLIPLSFILSFAYSRSGEAYFLAASWTMNLCAAVGFFLGNIISPREEVAKFPLSYFRTRILYKLILIFILLIIILLEATTIATINLNQISLQKAIKSNYMSLARSIADRIEGEYGTISYSDTGGSEYVTYNLAKLDKAFIQKLIISETVGKRYVYVVSPEGKLFIGPDPNETGRDLSNLDVVKKVLAGESGNDEYLSEFFEKAEDKTVIGTFVPIRKYKLGVIVEEPKWEAYAEIRQVSTNTLIFVIVGIFLTVSVGIFFAKSIESSIKEVIVGTQAVRKGDLSYKIKIDSIDEIGQLADAFNSMTRELKQSQEHLISSEKLASLGTMAAGMAHEIKNPLVSLRTFTQLLPQRYEDAEFRQKFSQVVPAEIDKINKIAESLLRFGRPHKPELTTANVNEILEEIIALFDNEARKNNVRITTKLAELPKITADAGQLSQAFVNIILNSIQAMNKGGELTVKTDVGEIIKLGPASPETPEQEEAKAVKVVFVEISDTGVGIPEENLKSIFDPFFTTKEVGGTGMGLPITLRIIEEHHGSIKVRSQVGKGTTFLITIPQMQDVKV